MESSKRFLIGLFFATYSLISKAQSWAMHEAQEDSLQTDPITIESIITFIIIVALVFLFVRLTRYLSSSSLTDKQYKAALKKTILLIVGIILATYCAICGYYEIKSIICEDKLEKRFSIFIEDANLYYHIENDVSYDYENHASYQKPITLEEISNREFDKDLGYDFYSRFERDKDIRENKSSIHTFNIKSYSPYIDNILAKNAEQYEFFYGSGDLYIIAYHIKPSRIRYITSNIYPDRDIYTAFSDFTKQFQIITNKSYDESSPFDLIRNNFTSRYYSIKQRSLPNNIWSDKEVLSKNDNSDLQSVYIYDIINYGNFEILYEISYSTCFKIEDERTINDFFGPGKVKDYDIKKASWRYIKIYSVFCILLAIVFAYSYFKRKKITR